MADIVVHDNIGDHIDGSVNGGFYTVQFSFTSSSLSGYGLSSLTIGLYAVGASNTTGSVSVSLYGDLNGQAFSSIASLGSAYDTQLGTTSGSLYTFSNPTQITLAPSTRYWIQVQSTFFSTSVIDFSSSTAGTDISGESATGNVSPRGGNGIPPSNTGSYIARLTESPSSGPLVVCFALGTRILTSEGEVPVEYLKPGALVFSVRSGSYVPVLWVGRQVIREAGHRAVRIMAGAFGPGLPHADLTVSPHHALFDGDLLFPAHCLVNGATIRWEPRAEIRYFHVECPSHDVLLANGMPAESWLDSANRHAFDNAAERSPPARVMPGPGDDAPGYCVPCQSGGPDVAALRRRLHERALALGCHPTRDADLHIVADGTRIEAVWSEAGFAGFEVAPGQRDIRLMSRTMRPQDLSSTPDTRTLGIAVGALMLDGRMADLEALDGAEGWHGMERNAAPFRWTNGAAVLPAGLRRLRVALAHDATYLVRGAETLRSAMEMGVDAPGRLTVDAGRGFQIRQPGLLHAPRAAEMVE